MDLEPDVVDAVAELHRRGVLSADQTARLGRVARGELVSVRLELQALLYAGVLLVTTGAGLLVAEHRERIGPTVVAAALGLAAAGCLTWVARRAPPFTWRETAAPHLAYDYILLLGALLAAADLAYVEVQFTPLGAGWPWHLLIVAVLYGGLALRFDSRTLFSLALAAFAAWRGVAVSLPEAALWRMASEQSVRLNAGLCGVLFLGLGAAMARGERKAHWEPVATHLGCLLVLGALASGLGERAWGLYALALLACGAGLAAHGLRARRFPLLAFGVVAGYVAAMRFVLEGVRGDAPALAALLVSAVAMIALLLWAYRATREPV